MKNDLKAWAFCLGIACPSIILPLAFYGELLPNWAFILILIGAPIGLAFLLAPYAWKCWLE